jgi:hypothetical protein
LENSFTTAWEAKKPLVDLRFGDRPSDRLRSPLIIAALLSSALGVIAGVIFFALGIVLATGRGGRLELGPVGWLPPELTDTALARATVLGEVVALVTAWVTALGVRPGSGWE